MKHFVLVLLLLFHQVAAQPLKYIPDEQLRNALSKENYLTNDSLDLEKIKGYLGLNLNGKGIKDLNGLQYFEQVERLDISYNQIKNLSYLPPHLRHLNCSFNQITVIDTLPASLEYLTCESNPLRIIHALPDSIQYLSIKNNQLITLPALPAKTQYLNYKNNPIDYSTLPSYFHHTPCEDDRQNCLPFLPIPWNLLTAKFQRPNDPIQGMKVEFSSDMWGPYFSKVQTISYRVKKSELVAKKMHIYYPHRKDSLSTKRFRQRFSIAQLQEFLEQLHSKKMPMRVVIEDSITSIDLRYKKNGWSCGMNSSHPCYYRLSYWIYRNSDTIRLNYGFEHSLDRGLIGKQFSD